MLLTRQAVFAGRLLSISSGHFERSLRAGELIHSVAVVTSSFEQEQCLLEDSNQCDQAVAFNGAEANRFLPYILVGG